MFGASLGAPSGKSLPGSIILLQYYGMDDIYDDQNAIEEKGKRPNYLNALNSPSVKFSDVMAQAKRYWYWIVFFLVICVGYAWLSLQRTVPLYRESMTVLLRDDVQGNGMGSVSISLGDLGLTQSYTILDDEIEALQSPDLMEEVVVALDLATQYTTPKGLHKVPLYGSTLPVKVLFPDMQPTEKASLKLEISPEGEVTVTDLKVNSAPFTVNPEAKLEFGDAINTPSGQVILQKTPFFKEGQHYEIYVNHLPLALAVKFYGNEMEFEKSPNKKSNVITISCTDSSRDRADDILLTLIKCYMQDWIRGKAEVVEATNEFISQRLAAVEQELSGVDSNISSYKSSNLIPDVMVSTSLFMQQSTETSNEIMNYTNQLQMARYLKNYISSEGSNQVLPANTGLNDSNIETLIAQYNNLVIQRNALIANTSENNPLIIDLDSRMASLRRSILKSIDNTIVALSNTLSMMERKEQSSNAKVAASPQQAKYLLSAERKQKVQENLYLYLLQKREENELSQSFINVNTRVLRKPSGSDFPISPRKGQTVAIALILGLLIPIGTIYVLELRNNTVRGRKDIERMDIPVVGEIPAFKKSSKKKMSYFSGEGKKRDAATLMKDIVVEDGNRNMVNEAIRVLRSNITRMTAGSMPSAIMVTSFNPGSGKTFVTMNLGVSLALKHHKVLVIDCDMRRASLSRFVGSPRKGLADYLSGAVSDINSLIQKDTAAKGLDLLPVGVIPPNPTELLETENFKSLISQLKKEYDFIFIDCPPAQMMADAQIVADVADRTLFVIRVGLFKRALLNEVNNLYIEKKYPNMMLVLNDSDTGASFGYSYSYGYGLTSKDYHADSKVAYK